MADVIKPITITESSLVSCSIPVDADADVYGDAWQGEWSGGPHSTGDVVYKGIVLYENQVDSNEDDPEVGAALDVPTWQELGWINRMRAFDEYISGSSSSAIDEMVYVLGISDADHIPFYDLVANDLKVEILDADDAVVWTYGYDLLDASLDYGDWWEYNYAPYPDPERDLVVELDRLVNADLGEKVRITLSGSGEVSMGMCIPGMGIELGITQWEFEAGDLNYSEITEDKWGRTKFEKGPSAKLIRGSIRVPQGSESYVYRILSRLKGEPVVFNLNNPGIYYDMLSVYGSLKDHRHVMYSQGKAICSIQIKGGI